MSAWLLSIVGIIIVGAVLEIVLTDSGTAKFIKGIYGFFVLFVIISPLPKLAKQASEAQFEIPQIAVSAPLQTQKGAAEAVLRELGIGNAIVSVSGERIYINKSGIQTTLSAEDIKNVVASALNINKERVEVYG